MLTRIISSVILFPLFAALILLGGIPLKIAITGIILGAMSEVYSAFSKKQHLPIFFVGYLFACIYMLFLDPGTIYQSNVLFMIILSFIFSVLITLVVLHQRITAADAMVTIFGFFYAGVLTSTIYFVRDSAFGSLFVWLIFISAWGSDTGAYFIGRRFGKHKLIPTLSAKKTVEGAIGGLALATLLGAIYGMVVSRYSSTTQAINVTLFCVMACFAGSILSVFGDLAASSIKRYTGIKDFGSVIPGHGGILDRFDSVLFTAPAVYIVMLIML